MGSRGVRVTGLAYRHLYGDSTRLVPVPHGGAGAPVYTIDPRGHPLGRSVFPASGSCPANSAPAFRRPSSKWKGHESDGADRRWRPYALQPTRCNRAARVQCGRLAERNGDSVSQSRSDHRSAVSSTGSTAGPGRMIASHPVTRYATPARSFRAWAAVTRWLVAKRKEWTRRCRGA
jgi:hypothetical protein